MTSPVTWTAEKLAALREGTDEARRLGRTTVLWIEREKYRKNVEHVWPVALAEQTLDRVSKLFDDVPVRAYPENREGREP